MYCSSLKKLELPKNVRGISSTAFLRSSLDTLIIRGHIDNVNNGFLSCLNETTKLYVPSSEIDRYRNVFAGEVLPLENYDADDLTAVNGITLPSRKGDIYDLQGRKMVNGKLPRGIYIEGGKKKVK